MKYYYIYKVTLPETGEFYLGRRTCNCLPDDDINYKGSMSAWKVDKSKLSKEIINTFFSSDELTNAEIEIITQNYKNPLNKNSYIPGKGFAPKDTPWNKGKCGLQKAWNKDKKTSEITKNKIKNKLIGNTPWNKGIPMTEEARKNLSNAKLGCKGTNNGRKMSEETKEKIRQANLGKKASEETKKKMSKTRTKINKINK